MAPYPGVAVACPTCEEWVGLMEALVTRGEIVSQRRQQPKVWALIRAGWTIEFPAMGDDADPYQWKWRRPSRRPGKPGRLFGSTDQAFNAMRKEGA
jgi:anti-sigma factor ChrR (cupin superfamily)